MKEFLRDYWPWIVLPFLLVVGLLVAVLVFGGGQGSSGFDYAL